MRNVLGTTLDSLWPYFDWFHQLFVNLSYFPNRLSSLTVFSFTAQRGLGFPFT